MRLVSGWLGLVICVAALLSGCGRRDPVAGAIAMAPTNRAGACAILVTARRKDQIKLSDARDDAHRLLVDEADMDAVMYAAALLDAYAQLEPELPNTGPEFELAWAGVGALAGDAAARAWELGDEELALELVFAGPKRWKTETYWLRHPYHDALASYLLHMAGRTNEAINRLRSRPIESDEIREALEVIQASPGGALPQPGVLPPG